MVIVGAGVPVVVTVNVLAVWSSNVALSAEVISGAESTVSVKLWVVKPTPLVAVNVVLAVEVIAGVSPTVSLVVPAEPTKFVSPE